MNTFVALSLVPMLCGVLAAVSCTLIGNFLLLRRQSLLGDAISHVVLPGIVVAFIVSGAIAPGAMLAGAAAAALVAIMGFEVIQRTARVETGAAMGAVFTAMFALGVLLLEQTDTSNVHLDVEHALYGNLENLIWLDGTDWGALFRWEALRALPHELPFLAAASAVLSILIALFYKELRLSLFDPGYAAILGFPSRAIGFAIVVAGAITAVASFTAVGSILVIAMYICPAAAARLLTDRLDRQIVWSATIAAGCGALGFMAGAYGPIWAGFSSSVSASGMIAVFSGFAVLAAALAGPRDVRQRSMG